jgi:predicted DNA binding CopG/RHH family protein
MIKIIYNNKNETKKGVKIMEEKEKKTIWIDSKLHTRLKTLASKNGMKMGTFVEGLINKSLEGDKRNVKKLS